MVNITIDGKALEVQEGTTVLRAAQTAGFNIPTLCDHKALTPYGGCRMCLVEIDGFRTLQPSCTLPVSNGMVIHTDTEKVRTARKFVLTLIFSERNHFCPYCQVSGGDCELQNAAYAEGMTNWPLQPNFQMYPMDASHKYIIMENNRCILCRRCVRACSELVGNFTLGFEERGAKSFLVADLGTPLGESTCISCGMCVQVCPTGAIIDRWSAYRGHKTESNHHPTVCVGCSIGCGIDVLTRDNNMVCIDGDWNAPVNFGLTCEVGRFHPMVEERQRIVTPLVRKDGLLRAATWEEALKVAADHLKAGEVAAVASTRLSVESLSAFKQIASEQLKSDMVTSTEEGMPCAAQISLAAELSQPFEARLDVLNSADLVVVVGADLVEEHEVAGFMIKRAQPNGLKLITVDAESNSMDEIADVAIKSKASEADVLAALKQDSGLEAAAVKIGVKVEALQKAASLLSAAKQPVVVFGKGMSAKGTAAVKAVVEFAKSVGAQVVSTKGGANSLAAALMGFDQVFSMNGHQTALVALGDEAPAQRLVQRLEKAPFKIVLASYVSQLTSSADVVLPVATWMEQEGHFVSMDGRIQKAEQSLEKPEGVKTNQEAIEAIAAQVGAKLSNDWQARLSKAASPVALTNA